MEETENEPGQQVVELGNGARWAALERGAGEPVCLLHGFTGRGSAWGSHVLGGLAETRRVLAPDLPGHGESSTPSRPDRVAMEQVVADLGAVLDALDADRVDLVGYSMGARLALAVAVLAPGRVRRLVLESGSPGLSDPGARAERRAADAALARGLLDDGLEPFLARWNGLPLFASQQANLTAEELAAVHAGRAACDPVGLAMSLLGMGTGSQPSLWETLGEVRAPVLVLAGGLDAKYVGIGGEMARALPNADLRVFDGVGHRVHLEAPGRWLAEVSRFLR